MDRIRLITNLLLTLFHLNPLLIFLLLYLFYWDYSNILFSLEFIIKLIFIIHPKKKKKLLYNYKKTWVVIINPPKVKLVFMLPTHSSKVMLIANSSENNIHNKSCH